MRKEVLSSYDSNAGRSGRRSSVLVPVGIVMIVIGLVFRGGFLVVTIVGVPLLIIGFNRNRSDH